MWLGWWLAACEREQIRFVEPFDGSSAVLPQDPLVVHLDARYPDGEPVPPDVIGVVDLVDGGAVPGATTFVDGAVVFEPELPWTVGGSYGWAVTNPLPRARAPILEIPSGLVGESSFRVGGERALLDASLDGAEVCLLFSDSIDEIPRLTLGELELEDPVTRPQDLELPGNPEIDTVTARCLDLPDPDAVAPGSLVRAWDREGASTAAALGDSSLAARWKIRHRWMEP